MVKERFRNTFTHGGFETAGSSLYVQLPDVGTVPVSMTAVRDSPHFHFFPIADATYSDICALLDEFDAWLEKRLTHAFMYVRSGLDVPFDERWMRVLKDMAKDEATFEAWLDRQCTLQDIYENADY